MSVGGELTLQSVESLLAPMRYVDRARVARDVLGLLRNSNSLQIKVGPFVHGGRSDTLLSLTGTIPIDYKGACYNIPVTIWVGEAYPARPPSCFVTPTKDMRIKDGHLHVDHYGVVYLPYLNQWSPQSSSLIELVTIMSSVFSQDPPVFKVPSAAAAAAAAQQQPQPQQPPQQQAQSQLQRMQPQMHIGPGVMQQQMQQQPQVQQQPQQQSAGVYRQAPPVPPAQFNNPYAVPQAAGGPSPVSQSHAASPSSAQLQQRYDGSPSPAPVPAPQSQAQVQQAQDPRATLKNQLIAKLTLKMRAHLQDELSLKTLLMDDLLQQQSQVETHTAAVDARLDALQADLEQVQRASQTVRSQSAELEKWLEQNEKRPMPDIDSVCYVKDTWSKQLLDAVSLDLALDDAFYLLDRSLQEESIDLQSYTKQLRALSRKQFYARALIIQIQQQQTAAQSQSGVQLAVPQQPHMQQQQHQQQQHAANGVECGGGLGGGYVLMQH